MQVEPPAADGLTPAQRAFCLEYLANGFNGTRAYQHAYPGASYASAMTSAYALLRLPQILDFLNPLMQRVWKARQMDGEQALARVAMAASIDVRVLFDARGRLRHPKDWPEEIAGCVKQIQHGRYGLKLTLTDPLTAQRIILEQTGKLKSLGATLEDLVAGIVSGDDNSRGEANR